MGSMAKAPLALFVAFAFLLGIVQVAYADGDGEGDGAINGITVYSWQDLADQLNDQEGAGKTFTLGDKIEYEEGNSALVVTHSGVTIDLNGFVINRRATSSSSDSAVIYVRGGELTLVNSNNNKDSEIMGGYADTNGGGGIVVEDYDDSSNTKLTINSGIAISENTSKYGTVHVRSGSFILNGGIISANTDTSDSLGGGVCVESGGKFTMESGSITGNKASIGGGVFINPGGSFTMRGGSITKNEATRDGGGVYVNHEGEFYLHAGSITGNEATMGGGVYVQGPSSTRKAGILWFGSGTVTPNISVVDNVGGNVYLCEGAITEAKAELTGNSRIGFTVEDSPANTSRKRILCADDLEQNSQRYFSEDPRCIVRPVREDKKSNAVLTSIWDMEPISGTNGWEVVGYWGPDTNLTIPSKWEEGPVTSVGAQAFQDSKKLESVTISSSVTSIGNLAFSGCPKLSKVIIEDAKLKTIGDFAFSTCTALKSISLPNSLKSLGKVAFGDHTMDIYFNGTRAEWDAISKGEWLLRHKTLHIQLPGGGYAALVNIDDAKVVLSKASLTYNGKAQKPKIKTIGGKALKEGTDYTAKWPSSSKKAGSYQVTITGAGGFFGTTTATYKIAKAKNTLVAKAKSKKAIAVKAGKSLKAKRLFKISKKKGKVTYKKVNKAGGKKITVTKKGTVKVKKGCKKGTYTLKVKVKAKGTSNYKAGSKIVKVKLKVK